ncbi:hypothetical protein Dimus_009259 [Dionaea muscipula]
MEATAQSVGYAKLYNPLTSSCKSTNPPPPPFLFPSKTSLSASHTRSTCGIRGLTHKQGRFGVVLASAGSQQLVDDDDADQRWLLEPIGDGDWRHIGFEVQMPGPYEIVSNVVTVGRLPDKADLVISVATVSGLHARIQKKGGSLYITDLKSTNGTFIDERRLIPGVITNVPPGSRVTFGDTHLAIFRASKLESSASVVVEDEPKEMLEPEGAIEAAVTLQT